MIRGLYTAASGMMAEALRNDVVANNLANVNTIGFKRDRTIASPFPEMMIRRINDQTAPSSGRAPAPRIGTMGTGVVLEGTWADMQQGAFQHTGRNLDVAIVGDGFLAVAHGDGLAYTRDGRLQVTADGWLTDAQGRRVVGVEGPIRVYEPEAAVPGSITIGRDGIVTVDSVAVGQLAVHRFEQPAFMRRLGDNLWQATEHSGAVVIEAATVEAEHLESSNVNVVAEMVKMIQVQRAYEANQRVLQAHDETLGRAVNDIASF